MSGFGDLVAGADTHDDARPDPEAVARILWALLIARLPSRFESFDRHPPAVQTLIVDAFRALLIRLVDDGPRGGS